MILRLPSICAALLASGILIVSSASPQVPTPPQPSATSDVTPPNAMQVTLNINDLSIHDPYVFADEKTKTYIVYKGFSPARGGRGGRAGRAGAGNARGTSATQNRGAGIAQNRGAGATMPASAPTSVVSQGQVAATRAGVCAYTSKDLKTWTGPQVVFEMPEDFWCDTTSGPWAPEVHAYNGKYYLFTTFNAVSQSWGPRNGNGPEMNKRASQILVADSPLGPFKAFANKPTTPDGQMTLDATFYVEDGQPYIVYCHEWVQAEKGTIDFMKLKPDLSETVGEPTTILHAADFDWTAKLLDYRGTWPGRVTDGPELYKLKGGTLAMLWASHSENHFYAQAVTYSKSGKLAGPWTSPKEPLLWEDRGHGMLFHDFDGNLRLSIFRYFRQPATRMQIWDVEDTGDTLKVKDQLLGTK